MFLFTYDNEMILNSIVCYSFFFYLCIGKGRTQNFNYGLYWPLWDLICGTRYRDLPNTDDVNHSSEIKEHTEKKLT